MRGDKLASLDELLKIFNIYKGEIRQRFKVKEIGIFGSYVRNEQGQKSDIDILVEFEDGYKTFDNYMELKFFLEKILNSKIDLVLKTTIRDEIKQNILSEVTYV